jgi:D-hexose-6-phosphate mutarotase
MNDKKYFVTSYDEFKETAKNDAYNWYQNGCRSKDLSDEDIINEFSEEWRSELITEEEASDKADSLDDFHTYFSTHDMCEAIRENLENFRRLETENQEEN